MAVSVGLELGDVFVRGVTLERQGSGIRLVASAEAPWSGEAGQDLIASLKQLRKSLPIKSPVTLGIPTSAAVVAAVEPLVVHPKRAELAIQFELQQHLPYDVNQTVWHYRWYATNGGSRPGAQTSGASSGPRRRSEAVRPSLRPALVAAMKRSLLEERLNACKRAGIAVDAVGVSAVATVNAWWRQLGSAGDPTQGVVLHIEGLLIEWIIVTPSGVHPVASLQHLETPDPQQTVEMLKSAWNALREQFSLAARPTVWLAGEPGALPLSLEALEGELACAMKAVDLSGICQAEPKTASSPRSLVTACGLALQGLGLASLPVNLLSEMTRLRQVRGLRVVTRSISWCGLLLALALTARAMMAILKVRQDTWQRLVVQEQTYQKLRPEARAMIRRQAQIETRLHQLDDLAAARALIVQALHHLTEVLPDEIWLAKLDLSKDDTAMNGQVEGYSRSFQSVTQLMDQLKSSAGWASVKPLATTVTTEPTSGKELVAFTIRVQQALPTVSKPERSDSGQGGSSASRQSPKHETSPGSVPASTPKLSGSTKDGAAVRPLSREASGSGAPSDTARPSGQSAGAPPRGASTRPSTSPAPRGGTSARPSTTSPRASGQPRGEPQAGPDRTTAK
ncbi:MAG: PilN domain-containing protein [Candidatus Omnitrophica bacterium]|nr:PilN domain-containing protein [Candidatus Omnitrophota bacterium]